MMQELQPYGEYKEPGQPWLGNVPEHWELTTIGSITSRRSARNRTDLPLLSVLREKGVVLRSSLGEDENHNFVPDDLGNYRVALAGDLVVNKMKAWQGSVGIAPCDGIVSPAYFVFELLKITQPFAHRLFRSKPYVAFFAQSSDGVRIGQWDLSIDRMKRIPVPIPPPDEQAAIVRFLAALDGRVNRFVRAKRRLIELLTEQKQAIITQAVTRGLDPNAKLKASGIDWLGDVPEHWEPCRLKNAATVHTGITLGKDYGATTTRPYRYLRVANVQVGRVDLSHVKEVHVPEHEARGSMLEPGDVLMTEGGDIDKLGRGCVWNGEIENCIHQNHIFAVRCRSTMLPRFLVALMGSSHGRAYFQLTAKQTTNLASTNSSTLRAFPVFLPPVTEQECILSQIETDTSELERTMAAAQREIALIREYRTRLVADVVTGKLDVRAVLVDAPTVIETKPKANIHFQRSVFAAEIIHRLHAEPTFGHVKFEKLMFLCEKRCGVDTGSHYHRDAAGPYDNRALRSIDSQIKKQKWYEASKGEKGYRYVSLEKAGEHRSYFDRYFGSVASQFDEIIETFRTLNTERCEIVATLYSAWEDLLRTGDANDDQIIEQVLEHWHPRKKEIAEDRWRKALGWMRKRGLVPRRGIEDGV